MNYQLFQQIVTTDLLVSFENYRSFKILYMTSDGYVIMVGRGVDDSFQAHTQD
jgi:hypothetical protein